MKDPEKRIGNPTLGPKGRGGIYSTTASGDPFFDAWDDTVQRIKAMNGRLAESPPVRPYLAKYGLYYGLTAEGLLALRCQKCSPASCSCGDIRPRSKEFMVDCFHDPELRPIFDNLKLAVRE